MKVVINIRYKEYRQQIVRIVENQGGEIPIRALRNIITQSQIGSNDVIVKRFAVPKLCQRIIYTFFRRSKAARSYNNTLILRTMEIDSPEPIAYVEQRKSGLFHTGYYICLKSKGEPLSNIFILSDDEQKQIISALASYSADMHRKGVYFSDYNAANILYHKDIDGYSFEIIDVNRIKFLSRPLTLNDSIKVLTRLRMDFSPQLESIFLQEYADIRGYNWQRLSGIVLLRQSMPTLRYIMSKIANIFRRSPKEE